MLEMSKRSKKSCRRNLITPNLLDLPDEMIFNIAEYLPVQSIKGIRSTCSRLHRITHSKEVMEKQKFIMTDRDEIKKILEFLMEMDLRFLNLQFENIDSFDNLPIFDQFFGFHGYKINSLKFKYCDLTQEFIENVMFLSTSLKELILEEYNLLDWEQETRITPHDTNTTLKTLQVISETEIHPDLIKTLLIFYPHVDSLTVRTPYIENSTSTVAFIMNYFTTHQQLVKKLCLIIEEEEHIGESLLHSNLRLEKCKELTLNWVNYFTPNGLKQLLSRCKTLESLIFHRSVSRICFVEMLNVINEYGQNLTNLVCPWITFHYLSHPCNFNSDSFKLPRLRKFELAFHVLYEHLCLRKDFDIRFLAHCNLTHLNLSTDGAFLDAVWSAVAASQNSLVELVLKINNPNDCRPEVLQTISNLNFPNLEYLAIIINYSTDKNVNSHAAKVTRTILNKINFPKLESLHIHANSLNLEPKELKKILTECPCLQNVNIWSEQAKDNLSLPDIMDILEMDWYSKTMNQF